MRNLIFLFICLSTNISAQIVAPYMGVIGDNSLLNARFGILAETNTNPSIGLDVNFTTYEGQRWLNEIYSELGYSIRPYLTWKIKDTPVQLQVGTNNGETWNIRAIMHEKISGSFGVRFYAGWNSKGGFNNGGAFIGTRVYLNLLK